MRAGVTLFIQGYQDWDRYEAAERGEKVPGVDGEADTQRWREEIDTALKLEEWGFDSIWTVEHHVSPYTMITNPIQLLTYLAGATSKVDVGTMVTVLPWHHPIRVAEDMTMLQHLLNGRRAFIGVGRGAARREFAQLGFDMNQSKERFAESAEVIKLALTNESFSYDGTHYQFDRVTLRPRPRDGQQLIDDMHFSWGSPSSAPVGARLGLKPLIIPQKPWADYHADLAEFNKARNEAGHDLARPRVNMNVYCATNEEEARAGAEKYMPQYADSATRNYETYSDHFKSVKGYEHYANIASAVGHSREAMSKAMGDTYIANHVYGTPEQCIAKLRAIAQEFHPEEFLFTMRYGNMSQAEAEASTDLFAREVLPAIHEIEVQEPISYAA